MGYDSNRQRHSSGLINLPARRTRHGEGRKRQTLPVHLAPNRRLRNEDILTPFLNE